MNPTSWSVSKIRIIILRVIGVGTRPNRFSGEVISELLDEALRRFERRYHSPARTAAGGTSVCG
jgi:hypothetical protein